MAQFFRDYPSLAPAEIWAAPGVSRQGAMEMPRPRIEGWLVKKMGSKKAECYVASERASLPGKETGFCIEQVNTPSRSVSLEATEAANSNCLSPYGA